MCVDWRDRIDLLRRERKKRKEEKKKREGGAGAGAGEREPLGGNDAALRQSIGSPNASGSD